MNQKGEALLNASDGAEDVLSFKIGQGGINAVNVHWDWSTCPIGAALLRCPKTI